MASKGENKEAAWELVKFLSSPAFANPFGAHYGWAPVRSDVNTSKGDAAGHSGSTRTCSRAGTGCRRARRWPQLTDVYGQAIEAAATGKMSVKAALAKAQKDGTAILKS